MIALYEPYAMKSNAFHQYVGYLYQNLFLWLKHLPLNPKVLGSCPISCSVENMSGGNLIS